MSNISLDIDSRFIRTIIRVFFTFAILFSLFKLIDFSDVWGRLIEFDQRILFLIGIIFSTHIIAFAFRWYDIALSYAILEDFPWFAKQTMISYFFNQIALGTLGGDAFRIYSMVKIGFTVDQAVRTILIERAGIFTVSAVQAALSLFFIGCMQKNGILLAGFGACVICMLIGFTLIWSIAYNKNCDPLFNIKLLAGFAPIAKFFQEFLCSFKMFRVMLCSIYVSITSCIIYWLVAYGLGYNTHVIIYLLAAPFPILISMIPITISGWGVREMAFGLTLNMLGRASIEGITVSGVVGLLIMLTGLPGGLILLKQRISNYLKQIF